MHGLSDEFAAELRSKQEVLDTSQGQLRSATKDLVDGRTQASVCERQVAELEHVQQQIRNLEDAINIEDTFDWSSRKEPNGSPSQSKVQSPPHDPDSVLPPAPADEDLHTPLAIAIPAGDDEEALDRLRRMYRWRKRALTLLKDRIATQRSTTALMEIKYRRVVSLCTGVPLDKIEVVRAFFNLINLPLIVDRCWTS